MAQLFSFRKATDRKTECYWLTIHDVRVLISYETPVAFEASWTSGRYRCHNRWGPTTGRHFKETGTSEWKVIEDGDEFDRMLHSAIMKNLLKDHELIKDLIGTAVANKLVPEIA